VRKKVIVGLFIAVILLVGLSINRLPEYSKIAKSTPEESVESFTMISTGDVGLGRYVNYMIHLNNDPTYPFTNVANYTQNADLTIISLENPLIENCPIVVTGFKFCGKDTNVEGLLYAGVDAANLANNHTTNYGHSGLEETVRVLKEGGIKGYGLDNSIEYIELKGHQIALIGFVELGNNWAGLNNASEENILDLIGEANAKADIVIVSFHWGNEYTHTPSEAQVRLGRLAVDIGADIVLGNHAHWIQPYEIYKDKFIIYAQGNTVFDQDWSQKTKEGVLYKFKYNSGAFELIDKKYTVIENNAQPRFAATDETNRIGSYLVN